MAIDLATGFNIGSKDVIDERQVLTLEQMKNLDETIYPDNYFAMCKDNGKFYIFNSSNAINNTTGKFRLLEGNGGSGSTEGTKTYTSLSELELTPDVTIDDVVSALNDGETALIATSEFTNYLTMFPNQCDNDQYAMLKVEKSNSSSVLLEWLQKEGQAYAIGGLDDSNKFTNWNNLVRFKRDGFGDDNIISIGNTVSDDGSIQTLANLGLSKDIMTWETGIYKGSDVSGLTNLPSDVSSIAPAHFRLEHHNIQKWTDGRSPSNSIGGQRHSFYYSEGDVYHRYTESGDTPGVFIKDTGWTKICTDVSIITELENKLIKTYNTLDDLGLTAPVTVGEIYNAMADNSITILDCDDIADHVTDVPVSCGVLTIKKKNSNRFSIDYQNSLGGNVADVKRWIATLQGLDGRGLTWKLLSTDATYTLLSDMGLTSDATFQDVVDALPTGGSALLGVKDFTNYQTIFPYEEGNDQFARVHIVKGVANGSSVYARWFRKDGVKEAIAIFNINDNKFNGWQKIITENSKTDPYSCTGYTVLTGTEDLFTLPCGHYATTKADTAYNYPITDSSNVTAHIYVLGCLNNPANNKGYRIILYFDNKDRMYRINEWWGNFSNGWQKIQTENVKVITADTITKYGTEILKYPVGTWCLDSVNLGKQFTDLPLTGGMAGIIEIDSIYPTKSPYEHAYGYRNYTFRDALTTNIYIRTLNSGNTAGTMQRDTGWKKVCTDETRLTTVETQVSELFQSVSNGKTLVANAITGKGVSTLTTATFATMATNISKITSYKEETKTYTLSQSGIQALTFTFSANVIAVKSILAPYDGYSGQGSCTVSAATSVKDIFKIEGKIVTFYASGGGMWQVTALVQA
jgi:hypothetical protein